MQFRQSYKQTGNDKLSLSRNLTNSDLRTELSLNNNEKQNLYTVQKRILKVYLTEDSRIFISREAAYSLGYLDVKAIALDDERLFELSDRQLAQIKARENIEITYEKLLSNRQIIEKPKIQVFYNNIDYYISTAAAYSIGLLSVEQFNNMSNQLYQVSDNLLEFLKNKYTVEYTEIEKGKSR